jgi:hypothetical protein
MKRLILAALAAIATFAAHAATTVPPSLINPAGSTAGQAIVSTGPSTAPGWSKVSVAGLAAQAANTVLANVTASSASPTAFAMPSCSTSTSALQYTSGTGFTCFTGSAPLASPTFTGTVTITNTSGNSLIVNGSGNSGSGAQFFLQGNGATTPNKYIRAFNGAFQIVNSANSATPMSMDDAGNVTFSGGVTGTAGSFTTLSASGLSTLTGGIAGNASGTAASAGTIGEVISQTFSAVNMATSGTVQNLTSINLTAGVYLVWGSATYTVGTGATMNIWLAGVSQTSATLPAAGTYFQSNGSITATGAATANAPMYLMALTSAKTIYLAGDAIFSGGAVTATGFLAALRIH